MEPLGTRNALYVHAVTDDIAGTAALGAKCPNMEVQTDTPF
jgi:hypothetical protein